MTHVSLFSGIGGFDLAAEWMGWKNKFHCEWNPFGQQVLKHYWPNAELFTDITKSDFTKYANRIDVLTGGFPCQPYSTAGKRLGKEDERHLWPEMLRAIREIQPRWVVGENVRGLVSWNGGLVFDEVQTDLEAEGYEVLPFLLPACAVNAPHRRDRIWFIAYAGNNGSHGTKDRQSLGKGNYCNEARENEAIQLEGRSVPEQFTTDSNQQHGNISRYGAGEVPQQHETGIFKHSASNSSNSRLQRRQLNGTFDKEGQIGWQQSSGSATQFYKISDWRNFPTQPPVCWGDDGLSTELDGITFSKHRTESIKAYGNAVVPQVVYQIFKAIEQYESRPNGKAGRQAIDEIF